MNRDIAKLICLAGALVVAASPACRREDEPGAGEGSGPPPQPELLDFAPELRADDESVNEFITKVIEICTSGDGDYEAFRLLWSARDDPFPRDQFYEAWRSVRRVKIVALCRVRGSESGELLYAARAQVELAPTVREPQREVNILIVEEDGRWRLTKPPGPLPENLCEQAAGQKTPTTQPE